MLDVFSPQEAVTTVFIALSKGCVAALICSLVGSPSLGLSPASTIKAYFIVTPWSPYKLLVF